MSLVLPLMLVVAGCHSFSHKMEEDEEVRIFSLVADASASSDFPLAISRADSILKTVEIGDTLRAYIMLERNTAMLMYGLIDEGQAYADSVINFAASAGIPEVKAQAEQNLGVAFRRKGDYNNAIECYSRSVDLAMSIGDKELEQTATELLSICYAENNRVDEALKFAHRSLDLASELGDNDAYASSLATLAGSYAKADSLQKALDLIVPQLDKLDDANPFNKIKILTPAANAAIRLDSLDLASRIVSRMKEISSLYPEEIQIYSVALSAESALAAAKGDFSRQYQILCRLDSLPSHGRNEADMAKERAECLFNMGKYREAYTMLDTVVNSISAESDDQLQESLSEFSVKYETALKDLEIERLKAHRLILILIVVGCVAVLLIGIVFWIFLSRLRRHREVRHAQMEFIRGLEHERLRMARELHDDIAGDLVGLQYDMLTLPAEECSEKIMDVAVKVRSLSHNLMPPEFRQLSLPQLLDSLVHNASGKCEVKIVKTGSYPWDTLSSEQSLELYRIVQETINNAIKHSTMPSVKILLSGDSKFEITLESRGELKPTAGENQPGVGMRIMEIRADLAGCSLTTEKTTSKYIYLIREK